MPVAYISTDLPLFLGRKCHSFLGGDLPFKFHFSLDIPNKFKFYRQINYSFSLSAYMALLVLESFSILCIKAFTYCLPVLNF